MCKRAGIISLDDTAPWTNASFPVNTHIAITGPDSESPGPPYPALLDLQRANSILDVPGGLRTNIAFERLGVINLPRHPSFTPDSPETGVTSLFWYVPDAGRSAGAL